jgi:hypothetical protein
MLRKNTRHQQISLTSHVECFPVEGTGRQLQQRARAMLAWVLSSSTSAWKKSPPSQGRREIERQQQRRTAKRCSRFFALSL